MSVPFVHDSRYLNLFSPHLGDFFFLASPLRLKRLRPLAPFDWLSSSLQLFFPPRFFNPKLSGSCKTDGGTWSLVFKPLEKCIIQTPAHTCPHTDGRSRINWLFCVALVNIYTNRNMYEQPRSITQKSGSRAGVMSRYKAECNRHARTDRLHIICLHARPFTAARIPLTHPETSFLGGLLLPQEEAKQPGMSECK